MNVIQAKFYLQTIINSPYKLKNLVMRGAFQSLVNKDGKKKGTSVPFFAFIRYILFMQNYNSFIYIWFNNKTRMFYLGKHFGRTDDGYICSSKHMMIEYRKNPQYFKRRILQYVQDTSGNEILQAELSKLF